MCASVQTACPSHFKLLRIVRLAKLAKLKLLKLKNSKGKGNDSAANSTGPSVKASSIVSADVLRGPLGGCFRHFQTWRPRRVLLAWRGGRRADADTKMATSTTT